MILTVIDKIMFWKKEEKLEYPIPFGIIDYTDVAKLKNIKDDQNKIIVVRRINKYGNIEKVNFKYTEQQVNILESRGIPIYDKTRMKQRFDIVTKRNTGEIVYTR